MSLRVAVVCVTGEWEEMERGCEQGHRPIKSCEWEVAKTDGESAQVE